MSDNWIALIPQNVDSAVTDDQLNEAASLFQDIAPEAEEITVINQSKLRLFDCGGNLERIVCPHCAGDIELEWWRDQVEAGYEEGDDDSENDGESFNLVELELPCCHKHSDLSMLSYSWDQGFSRWGIDVMNPDIGELTAEQASKFESVLGCPIKVIYQHI
ncbi:MAG: hypothetical protein QGG42_14535 [Phycisphaerae bacterium]|jgi:hypothetical protein|nr:hypothetical protein [Phycisphaerae bacterium]